MNMPRIEASGQLTEFAHDSASADPPSSDRNEQFTGLGARDYKVVDVNIAGSAQRMLLHVDEEPDHQKKVSIAEMTE